MPSPKRHLLFIDSLRALAALYVVTHHALEQYYDLLLTNVSGFKKIFLRCFVFGHFAVDLFIVLSGFSLMLSLTANNYAFTKGIWNFYKRRVIRIVPPYYFAILFSLILIYFLIGTKTGTHWDVAIPVSFADVIKHMLFINDYFSYGSAHINHVFWSISVEFRIYLFFPLLVYIWKRFGPLMVIAASCTISVISTLLLISFANMDKRLSASGSGISPYLILFTLGMLAADISFSTYHKSISYKLRNWFINLSRTAIVSYYILFLSSLLIVALAVVQKLSTNYYAVSIKQIGMDILIGIFFSSALIILSISSNYSARKSWLLKLLTWKPLIFVGAFSYSLYLIHAPVLQLITQYVLSGTNYSSFTRFCLLLIIGVPVAVIVSYGFFYLFERPFISVKNSSMQKIEEETVRNPAP